MMTVKENFKEFKKLCKAAGIWDQEVDEDWSTLMIFKVKGDIHTTRLRRRLDNELSLTSGEYTVTKRK